MRERTEGLMAASGTSSRGTMYGVIVLLLASIGAGVVFLMTPMGAPKHTPTTASDGQPAWLIECSHSGDCIRESALTCPHGYDTVAQGAQTHSTVVNTGKVMVPVETFSGAMVIRCVGER